MRLLVTDRSGSLQAESLNSFHRMVRRRLRGTRRLTSEVGRLKCPVRNISGAVHKPYVLPFQLTSLLYYCDFLSRCPFRFVLHCTYTRSDVHFCFQPPWLIPNPPIRRIPRDNLPQSVCCAADRKLSDPLPLFRRLRDRADKLVQLYWRRAGQ